MFGENREGTWLKGRNKQTWEITGNRICVKECILDIVPDILPDIEALEKVPLILECSIFSMRVFGLRPVPFWGYTVDVVLFV